MIVPAPAATNAPAADTVMATLRVSDTRPVSSCSGAAIAATTAGTSFSGAG